MILCLSNLLSGEPISSLDLFIETLAWCCVAITVKFVFFGGFC
jgi:hypothetical protein